jgi:hypothetical protein
MAELEAHRLEEALGSLGVGRFTYQEWHRRTCGLCSPDYICPASDQDLDYEMRRREFRRQILAAWQSALKDLLATRDVTREIYESVTGQLRETTRKLQDYYCRQRERELGLVPIAPLTEAALPAAIHKLVLEMAERADPLARSVARTINDLGSGILGDAFAELKAARLAFSPEVQQSLGKLKVAGLVPYEVVPKI